MLSSVLNSERAIGANIQIMRVFVSLRRENLVYLAIKRKVDVMEKKYDQQFQVVFAAIRRLMDEDEKPKTPIGFHAK